MKVKIRTRLRKNGREIRKDVDENGRRALQLAGQFLQDGMVEETPRLTGRAQGSITWATSEARSSVRSPAIPQDQIEAPTQRNEVRIGSALWRFRFLEFGTARSRAFASIRGTFKRLRYRVTRTFVGEYNAAIDRAK